MDDGVDTGAIALQDWCFIRPRDDARSLWQRELGPMGIRLFEKLLFMIKGGLAIPSVAQDETVATREPALKQPRLAAS